MKPITVALLTALAGFAATSARADNGRVNVDIGLTFGSNRNAPVYVAPAPVYAAPVSHYAPARGHWEDVTTKTWMPGRWVTSRDRWGRPVRFFENGYFAYRTDRVWVDHRNHRGYDDRDGYRYNDDRRDDRRR
ncbi:MAG: hypothetical protein ABIZ49_01570 [Opitutaceae bacterium]